VKMTVCCASAAKNPFSAQQSAPKNDEKSSKKLFTAPESVSGQSDRMG
jgi:hypothetical protein